MKKKNDKLTDISAELDALYGTEGTVERARFDEEAWSFYASSYRKAETERSELKKGLGC